MNRIHKWAQQADASQESSTRLDQAQLRTSAEGGLHHALFVPLHYEPNYAYPLVVWLHSPGGDERQLQRVMPLISMRNYVAVGPRGTCEMGGGLPGFRWRQTESEILAAEHRVFECIELAKRKLNVAPQRVFLAGFECGGTMAFRIGMTHPERFGGVLSVGGPFPAGKSPLARISQARGLPLFIAQGRDALKYPVDRTCEDLRLFHVAGLSVTLRQYPCGDELDTQMLHDMDVWIMERVTGVSMSPGDEPHSWRTELN
jgi:phospholipase/carboxylesterase